MNYQKIYDDICKRGQERILPKEVYTEKHHIIPKCLGGGNNKENLTKLTAREHFLVHYILSEKLYPKSGKLWYAFLRMCNSCNEFQQRHIPSSKLYDYVRQKYSETNKGIDNQNYGRKLSDYHKKMISDANKGKQISDKHKLKLKELFSGKSLEERYGEDKAMNAKKKMRENCDNSGSKNPMFGKNHGADTKKKISNSLKGNIPSEETRQKIRERALGRTHSIETKQKCREIALKQSEETKKKKSENSCKNKKCQIDGVEFRSVSFAGKLLGIPVETVRGRIKSNNIRWVNWKYI